MGEEEVEERYGEKRKWRTRGEQRGIEKRGTRETEN